MAAVKDHTKGKSLKWKQTWVQGAACVHALPGPSRRRASPSLSNWCIVRTPYLNPELLHGCTSPIRTHLTSILTGWLQQFRNNAGESSTCLPYLLLHRLLWAPKNDTGCSMLCSYYFIHNILYICKQIDYSGHFGLKAWIASYCIKLAHTKQAIFKITRKQINTN